MSDQAFLSVRETAKLMCMSAATFNRKRSQLVRSGFPEMNNVMKKYVARDVLAWIESQSQAGSSDAKLGESREGVNNDAL